MKSTLRIPTASERFKALYDTISTAPQPLVVADAKAGAPEDISFAAAEDIGPDNRRHLGYKALSMLTISHITGTHISGKVKETVELYEDMDGGITARFGDSAQIVTHPVGAGTLHGHPHRDYPVPAHSADIAANSALLIMEQTLGQRA